MVIEPKYECRETYHGEPGQATQILAMILAHKDPDACLVWPFKVRKNGGGYGIVRHAGEDWRVHRLTYKIVHGEIPEGKIIMHSCDNPPCFNPKHLSPGTRTDNAADRHAKGRTKPPNNPWRGPRGPRPEFSGENNAVSKLTNQNVTEIRRRYSLGNCTQDELAKEFGVVQCLISQVVRRKAWKHIP